MNTSRPFHFHASGQPVLQLLGGALGQGAEHAGGEAAAGVAVAGGVGRAGSRPDGRAVGDDARDGIAAAVVVAEHLAEEAPDGRDRVEHPVAVLDAVFVEDVAGCWPRSGHRRTAAPGCARSGRGTVPNSSCRGSVVSGEMVRRCRWYRRTYLLYITLALGLMFTRCTKCRGCGRGGGGPWWCQRDPRRPAAGPPKVDH